MPDSYADIPLHNGNVRIINVSLPHDITLRCRATPSEGDFRIDHMVLARWKQGISSTGEITGLT